MSMTARLRAIAQRRRALAHTPVIEIDDCRQVYGDDVTEPCDRSPSGQCVYSWRDDFRRCVHCKRESGL